VLSHSELSQQPAYVGGMPHRQNTAVSGANGFARAAALGVQFRPETADDRELAIRIYASTRTEELAPVPWSDLQKTQFLRSQALAQSEHYTKHYVGASFEMIELHGQPAGRLYVHRGMRETRIVDISLLPAFRGVQIGGAILRDLQDQATVAGVCLTIHVEHANPARRLYERLGFQYVNDGGVYLQMRWESGGAVDAPVRAFTAQ
jgi:ribosomal protein S18 acetylase RimI-like enzyme